MSESTKVGPELGACVRAATAFVGGACGHSTHPLVGSTLVHRLCKAVRSGSDTRSSMHVVQPTNLGSFRVQASNLLYQRQRPECVC